MNNDGRQHTGLPNMEVSKGRDVPSRLFRLILAQEGIEGNSWESLMDRLLNDPRNPLPRNSKDRSSQKGNLNKALRADRMTWKTFEKGLRFLGVRKARIVAELTWPNQKTTCHYIDKYLGTFNKEDFLLGSDEKPLGHATHPYPSEERHLVLDPPADPHVDRSLRQAAKALDAVNRLTRRVGRIPLRKRPEAE